MKSPDKKEHDRPEGHKFCQRCGKEYGVDYFEGDSCQPFVAEKCDSIEKAGVVCKDCSAPPQESKASWEEEFDITMLCSKNHDTCAVGYRVPPEIMKSFISKIEKAAEERGHEKALQLFLNTPLTPHKENEVRQALLADLVKKVEKMEGARVCCDDFKEEVLSLLTPQE